MVLSHGMNLVLGGLGERDLEDVFKLCRSNLHIEVQRVALLSFAFDVVELFW